MLTTNQEWDKLKRVLTFFKGTINNVRFIGMKDLTLYTWADAAYAVHDNARSQTGGTMSLGCGVVHAKSSKQKLNSKSSTESEVIGTSDYCPYQLWMGMFMKAQGYELKSNILFQDNQSAIRIEKNGRSSMTGNTRHVNNRYF